MDIVCLDFETFFSKEYSLSKMTTEAYIRDPRFVAHGAAFSWNGAPPQWFPGHNLRGILNQLDMRQTGVLCHHAQFDGLILSHHYNVRPAFWFDTLSMARQVLGTHVNISLDSLARHYGLAAKQVPYALFKGKHWHALDDATQKMVADGCCHDVALTWNIFRRFLSEFPRDELKLIDLTIRMFTEPVLRGDINLLAKVWKEEQQRKEDLMESIDVTADDLQSAARFVELLEAAGVEVEYKNGTAQLIPAIAKTDQFMRDLLEDDDDYIRGLAQARLGVRSTIDQTRANRLGWMANRGAMPVYLKYGGAHTTRWSGGDKVNWQNLRRGSDLRKSISAPEGYLLATIDLSQIECRILNLFAGQEDKVDDFRQGRDPYVGIASEAYGREITKEDKAERGMGKQSELSCGFGCGAERFQATAKSGNYGPPVHLTLEEANHFVQTYRYTHPAVVGLWRAADQALIQMDRMASWRWGPLLIENRRIYLPNGGWINYETLNWFNGDMKIEGNQFNDNRVLSLPDQGWRMQTRFGWSKMYGAKLVENVVQAMARVVMSQAMARIADAGLRIVNSEHDKVAVVLKQDGTENEAFEFCKWEMTRVPSWMPDLPLACEGHLGERYE